MGECREKKARETGGGEGGVENWGGETVKGSKNTSKENVSFQLLKWSG